MINRHFKINTLLTYASNAVVMGSGFVLMYLINRYAGVEIYGELAIIIATSGILVSLLTARSGEAVTRFFVREKTNNNLNNAKLVVLIGLCVDAVLASLLFILFYALSDFIALTFLDNESLSFVVWMYGLITISTFIRGSMIGYFQAHEYFRVLNFINVLESSLKVVFLIYSFFVLNSINIEYIIYSYIFASFSVTIFIVLLFLKRFSTEFKNIRIIKNIDLLKEYFSFNMKTFFSTTIKAGHNNIDNLILGYFTDTKIVGIYQTLKNLLLAISFISTPFAMMTTSKIIKLYENRDYYKLNNLIVVITKKITIISSLVVIVIYFLLEKYFSFQNIDYDFESIKISFFILSLFYLLQTIIWWSRTLIVVYNPSISIYSNLLLLINSIWIPILLFKFTDLNDLIIISLSIIISYFPSWLFSPIIYYKAIRGKLN